MNAVLVALALLLAPAVVFAGKADVMNVEVVEERGDQWTFVVTVRHDDKDPDHWADWWIVRTPRGQELGRRVLLHSHADEQPFTRDARIHLPRDVAVVIVEAHDKVHGYGGKIVTVDLTKPAGPGYTVKRAR
jgi:hypothetical protein